MAFYATTRKVHRIFVVMIIILTALMAFTGIVMKYNIGETGLDRYVHNNLSILFTIVLVIMAFTGTYMYFYPWYMKRKQKKIQQQPAPQQAQK